jgi:hypothetical protein
MQVRSRKAADISPQLTYVVKTKLSGQNGQSVNVLMEACLRSRLRSCVERSAIDLIWLAQKRLPFLKGP